MPLTNTKISAMVSYEMSEGELSGMEYLPTFQLTGIGITDQDMSVLLSDDREDVSLEILRTINDMIDMDYNMVSDRLYYNVGKERIPIMTCGLNQTNLKLDSIFTTKNRI